MSHEDADWQVVVREQQRMFRLAERDHGLTRTVLAIETGLSVSTLKSYANETVIPLHNFRKLMRAIPDDLLSLVFEGTGKTVGTSDADDSVLEELACETAGYVADYCEAKRDGVVSPAERAKLTERACRIASKAHGLKAGPALRVAS